MEERLNALRCAAALSLLVALTTRGAVPPPKAAVSRAGALTLSLPAELLRSAEVAEQLTSGLTTVFVVAVTAKDDDGMARGGARIDVRFDLWEEKYLVTVTHPAGQERQVALAGEESLARWWSENPLIVIPARKFRGNVQAEVKLKMLPFSSQEQSDTQRWLARTLSASRSPGGEPTAARSQEFLRVIIETSIRRRPLLELQWSVRAEREGAP